MSTDATPQRQFADAIALQDVKDKKQRDDLWPYLRQYGSGSLAYSTLEPDLDHFVLDSVGYLAFKPVRHWLWSRKSRVLVLANPICAPADYERLLSAFIKQHPHAIFIGLSAEPAAVLESMGHTVNQFGIETDIPTDNFSLAGKKRAKLRQWRNKCEREGVQVHDQSITDCNNPAQILELSERWLAKKKKNRIEFLVRPLRFTQEPDVRHFWAYQNNRLIALAVFDPIYEQDRLIGYYHNMDRYVPDAPHGTSVFILLNAIEKFRDEGIGLVSLGMSPLCLQRGMKNEMQSLDLFTRKSFWYAFEKLNFLYPFQGNANHKKKFDGTQKPVYIASTQGLKLKELLIMAKAMGAI